MEYSGGAHGNETGVGAMLRASRMRLGEDLRSVAQMLCIRYPYLEAIEEGRFNELPGQTYAIGFIRAYSDHLGLDSDEVIRRYKVETAAGARGQELSFPTPVPETGIPGGAIVFVGIVVAVIAYGGWYISTSENNILADLVSPVPERLAEQSESAEQGTPSEPAQADETTEPAEPPKPEEPDASAETATADTPATSSEPAEAQDELTAESDQTIAEPSQEAANEPEAVETEAVEPDTEAAETAPPIATEQPAEPASAGSEPAEDVAETAETLPESPEPEEVATPEPATQTAPEPISEVADQVAASTEDALSQEQATEDPQAGTVQSAPAQEAEPAADTEVAQADTAVQPAPADEPVSTGEETASASEAESDAVPEAMPAPEPPPEASALPEDTVAEEEDVGDDAPPPEETAEEPSEEPTPQPLQEEVVTATEPAPPAEEPSAETSVASAGGPRIVLRAKTSSWIQVRDDAANQMLVTRLLRAGESYEVPDRPGLKLLTGNAGALEVVVGGQVAPSIGDIGVVRRGVVLDAERLLAGTAVDN